MLRELFIHILSLHCPNKLRWKLQRQVGFENVSPDFCLVIVSIKTRLYLMGIALKSRNTRIMRNVLGNKMKWVGKTSGLYNYDYTHRI